ncbi:MAG: ABC transporter permease, partial [Armatimonadetes bacterium]|nr:ABC transporter permease [Armatimonadota bacterium]
MEDVLTTIVRALALGTPLLWAALGEIYAERSGVVNLGVEGMMILGAFLAFAVAQTTGNPGIGLVAAAG